MSWEAIVAVATAVSCLVIGVSAVIGISQLIHLRKATQLEGMMRLFDELETPKVLAAIGYVRRETSRRACDEAYLDDDLLKKPVQGEAEEFTVLRWLERIGTLAKYGLIDPEPLYALNMPDYIFLWVFLSPIVYRMRTRYSEGFMAFDNAEYLCMEGEAWARRRLGSAAVDNLIARYRSQSSRPAD
jgi:hypothetical protein